MFGGVEALLETIVADLSPLCRSEYELDLRATRSALTDDRFRAAWAEGRLLTIAQLSTNAARIMALRSEFLVAEGGWQGLIAPDDGLCQSRSCAGECGDNRQGDENETAHDSVSFRAFLI
jgi:hypothetical protein